MTEEATMPEFGRLLGSGSPRRRWVGVDLPPSRFDALRRSNVHRGFQTKNGHSGGLR